MQWMRLSFNSNSEIYLRFLGCAVGRKRVIRDSESAYIFDESAMQLFWSSKQFAGN
jgi:hypothetical protein